MSRFSALPDTAKLGLCAWAALIALQLVWHAWWFPPQHLPASVLLAALTEIVLTLLLIGTLGAGAKRKRKPL